MINYYFLTLSLPALEIGCVPDMNLQKFETFLHENLSTADYEKTRQVRKMADIENVRRYWLKAPLDEWGSLSEVDLEEAIIVENEKKLPKSLFEFMDHHPKLEERLQRFPSLIVQYYLDLQRDHGGFLRKYARFERGLRLTLTGYRAKKQGRDLARELQFESAEDAIVMQLMSQKDSRDFVPPTDFEDILMLLRSHENHPLEFQKALMEYRFERIEKMVNFDEFSIDRILAYMIQYMMVDKWLKYDAKKGKEIVEATVKELT